MSWNAYIDAVCEHSKDEQQKVHCDKAAIIGMNGSMWTTSDHAKALKLEQAEIQKIVKAIENNDPMPLQTSGVNCEGVKYQFLRHDPDLKMVLCKKKDHGAITIQGTKTAIVIGHTQEGMSQGITNKGVGNVVDHLQAQAM